MATPTDQNDMMNRMTATAMAMPDMFWAMSMRFRPPAPAACAKAGLLKATIPSPAHALCAICRIFLTSIRASSAGETGAVAAAGGCLTERELPGDRHDARDRYAVQRL